MTEKSNPLLDARKRLGLTQKTLADMMGVAKNYIWLMEAGRKPITEAVRLKLDQINKIQYHRRERSWQSGPDGPGPVSVRESGDPDIPLPSQYPVDRAGPCPLCPLKDREIEFLRDALKAAMDRIPKP